MMISTASRPTSKKRSLGLGLYNGMTIPEVLRLSRLAEESRYDSVWFSEDPYLRDILPLATFASVNTKRVGVGTSIVNFYTKNPVYLAMAAAAIDEISDGRFILGVGRGVKSLIQDELHIRYGSYRTYAGEYLSCLRRLLDGEEVTFEGKEVKLTGTKLRFRPKNPHIPILLAAIGPKMFETAGTFADGVILNACTSEEHAALASTVLTSTWRKKERPSGNAADRPEVTCGIWTVIDDDLDRAYESVRASVGFILSIPGFGETYIKINRFPHSILGALREAFRWDVKVGDPTWHMENAKLDDVKGLVSDEMVETMTVCGPLERCKKRFLRFFDAGVTTIIINPMTPATMEKVDLLPE